MSDEEHHFESKADAGASKTYPQQAGTIRKNGYIVIKNRPCKVYLSLDRSIDFCRRFLMVLDITFPKFMFFGSNFLWLSLNLTDGKISA